MNWLMPHSLTLRDVNPSLMKYGTPFFPNELKRFQVLWYLKLIYAHMNWFAIGREYWSVISWVSIKAAPRAAVIPTITT